jgi:ribosome-associated protein
MNKVETAQDSELLCKTIVEGMQELKASDIVVLDLREIGNAVCDYFVICSGDSTTQVDGIGNSVVRHTRNEIQQRPWNIEGQNTSQWILIDYVDVVAHVFYKDTREFYELEDLWADAVRTDIPNLD